MFQILMSTRFFAMGINVEFQKGHLGQNYVENFFQATEGLVTNQVFVVDTVTIVVFTL